jgi:hypothetical protein
VTNSYTNSDTPISSSSSASDALFELQKNDNDDDKDELDHHLALALANADDHENASLASQVPGAWPADFAADDDLLDMSDEEDDDEEIDDEEVKDDEEADEDEDEEDEDEEIDDEEVKDDEEADEDEDEEDDDDLTRRLALAVANSNVLAKAAQNGQEKEKGKTTKRARAEDVQEEEDGLPEVAKKAKLYSSWLPEWAFVEKPTVPIHPGTNAAERMWWERYAARKGMVYHHDVFMCGQRPGDVL